MATPQQIQENKRTNTQNNSTSVIKSILPLALTASRTSGFALPLSGQFAGEMTTYTDADMARMVQDRNAAVQRVKDFGNTTIGAIQALPYVLMGSNAKYFSLNPFKWGKSSTNKKPTKGKKSTKSTKNTENQKNFNLGKKYLISLGVRGGTTAAELALNSAGEQVDSTHVDTYPVSNIIWPEYHAARGIFNFADRKYIHQTPNNIPINNITTTDTTPTTRTEQKSDSVDIDEVLTNLGL